MIALAALPLVVLSLAIILQDAAERERQAARRQVGLARAAALVAESFTGGHLSTVVAVALSPQVIAARADPEAASAFLARVVAANPDWFGLSVNGPDGETLARSIPASGSVNIADRPYFQQAVATGHPVVSGAIIGRLSGEPTVVLAVPVELEAAGRGVVIAPVPTEKLDRVLRNTLGVEGAGILLIDSEGKPLTRPDPERLQDLASLRGWAPAEAVLGGAIGHQIVDLNGEPTLVAYAPVPAYGWGALVLQPTAAVFAAPRLSLLEGIALLAAAVATVAGLGWHLGGSLSRGYRREVEARAQAETARAEAEAAGRRAIWLASTGEEMAGSLDYDTTLASVARSAVPTFADWCFIDLREPDGRVRRVAVSHADPARAELAERFRAYPANPNVARGSGWVLQTGQSELTPEYSEGLIFTHDDEHLRLVREMNPRSVLRVAMRMRERILGVLSFMQAESDRRFGQAELALAEELARRATLAIENARLYRQAQEAVRVRDDFLWIASHELRTPVTTVKGASQVLLRAVSRGRLETEALQRMLQRINQASNHLAELVDDLLDVSRLQAGRLPLRLETVDLASLTREALARSAEQLDGRHQLTVDLPSTACPVAADPDRIEQVLANLVENATRYSPDGGEIHVALRARDGRALLEVRDDGIGIPIGQEEAIFEPFGRAANATGQHLPGLGLGLYICRRIVEQHGGSIQAASDGTGLGTTVSVSLPLAGDQSVGAGERESESRIPSPSGRGLG